MALGTDTTGGAYGWLEQKGRCKIEYNVMRIQRLHFDILKKNIK